MEDLDKPIELKVAGYKVVLDSKSLNFNEANLNEFLQTEGGKYDYFGRAAVNLEAIFQVRKAEYEQLREGKFDKYKSEDKCSDKLATARAEIDPEVIEARKSMIAAQRNWRLVQQHLRSWDKTHENALNFGYNKRKELDKLSPVIRDDLEDRISKTLGS